MLQRTADGLLIETKKGNVWLEDFDKPEGKRISVTALKKGTKSYTSVEGASVLVDLYGKP